MHSGAVGLCHRLQISPIRADPRLFESTFNTFSKFRVLQPTFILLTLTLGVFPLLPFHPPSPPFRPVRSRPPPLPSLRPPDIFECILGITLHPFDCLMTNNFLCLLSIKSKFP